MASPSPLGYVTLCPPCSGAAFQRYTGDLRGVLCDSPRVRGTRAVDHLCRLCVVRQLQHVRGQELPGRLEH